MKTRFNIILLRVLVSWWLIPLIAVVGSLFMWLLTGNLRKSYRFVKRRVNTVLWYGFYIKEDAEEVD